MKKLISATAIALISTCLYSSAYAAAPANDLCTNAAAIPAAGPFPYSAPIVDITDATQAGDPSPSCAGGPTTNSVWYSFTPTTSGWYTFSTCLRDGSTTVAETVVEVYTGTCGTPAAVAGSCGSDQCDYKGFSRANLTAGTPYLIVVSTDSSVSVGASEVQLTVRRVNSVAPSNDTCAGATAMTTNSVIYTSLGGATNDYSLNAAGCYTSDSSSTLTPGLDLVFKFTAPANGNYSFRARDLDYLDNLVVYALNQCPAGSSVNGGECVTASNRSAAANSYDGFGEEVNCTPINAGATRYFVVDSLSASATDRVLVDMYSCSSETEPNDTPGAAQTLPSGISGTISPGSDVDFFSLGVVPTGSRIFAAAEAGTSQKDDFDLRVTTSTDTLEYDDLDLDYPFGYYSPLIAGRAGTGVQTFLRVSQYGGNADKPYRLVYAVQPASTSAVAETEPNDTIAQATSNATNYFSGVLSGSAPSSDVDIFGFTAKVGVDVLIAFDEDPERDNTIADGKVFILDSAGNVVLSTDERGNEFNSTSGAGNLSASTPYSTAEGVVFRAPSTGRYFVKFMAGGATAGDPTFAGNYLLSISGAAADSDNDGVPDDEDGCASDPAKSAAGTCGCGVSDVDANGNGVSDCLDPTASTIPTTPKVKVKKQKAVVTMQSVSGATFKITLTPKKKGLKSKKISTTKNPATSKKLTTGKWSAAYKMVLGSVTTQSSKKKSFTVR